MNPFRRAWSWSWSRFFRRLADAHRHFGNQYSNRREYEAAVRSYTRAAVRDPTYAEVFFSRGVLYWREFGDAQRAVQDLTRALELDPSRVRAFFDRALAMRMLQQYDQAIADLERYLDEGQDEFYLSAARGQLAELREMTGDGGA